MFPVMYLSGGTCVQLIIVGGSILKQFFNTVCEAKTVTTPECYLLFTCLAIVGAQLPNLNSIAKVSFIGTITAIIYCTLVWSFSIAKGRLSDLSYDPSLPESNMDRFGGIMNAVGIIFLAFRGHNLILEIQVSVVSCFLSYFIFCQFFGWISEILLFSGHKERFIGIEPI